MNRSWGQGTSRRRRVVAGGLIAFALTTLTVLGYTAGGLAVNGYCDGYGYGYGYGGYGYCPPANSAPVVTAPADQSSDEGENKSFDVGSFTDPDGPSPWQIVVSWGDGSAPETFSRTSDGALPPRSHTYADNGTYTVTVTVTDADNASDSDTFLVAVANLPPTCGPITAPLSPVQVGTLVTASAPFTDPGILDTHTASMNWDDGTTSAATVSEAGGSGTATATHTYTVPGVYTLTLTVTDKDTGSGQCAFQYVVIYDPSAGFVTGGGWINSPPGAYAADPTLSGKANFGFVSKYKKGASVPSGNTEFQFKAGDLNFNSTSYDWLVIAGARAQYKGSGTINGAGDHAFILTAIDGQVSGGGGVDKFRIKIWDKATGMVVYDNQLGAADTADPTMSLGGGSITVHKGS